MNPTPQKIEVPKEIADFARSVQLFDKVEELGKGLDLNLDQLDELNLIIRQTLLGKIPREELLKNIVDTLEVDDLLGDKIIREVNTQIFQKLRELLTEIHPESEGGTAEETLAHIENHELETLPGQVAHDVPHMSTPIPINKNAVPANLPGLSQSVHNPMESEVLQAKKPAAPQAYSGVDPYREPLA